MKQFLAVVLAALVVTGICVMTAGASQQSGVTPAKFAKLSKQVKKLSKQVKLLKKSVGQINGTLSCFTSVVPVTQYSGYTGTSSTTALDVTHQGGKVGVYLLTIDPGCVQGGSAKPLFKHLQVK